MGASVELVGLPGSGKSYVLQHGNLAPGPARLVPSGRLSVEKAVNIVRGILSHPGVARLGAADAMRSRPFIKVASRWLILLERIGRVSQPVSVLDEGPLQAAWGLFSWRPQSPTNSSLFTELVDSLPHSEQLVYVSAGQDYQAMIARRERTHPSYSASAEDLRLARDWMSLLLTQVRRDRNVVRYLNRIDSVAT